LNMGNLMRRSLRQSANTVCEGLIEEMRIGQKISRSGKFSVATHPLQSGSFVRAECSSTSTPMV
jgi:hypothetical protein